MSDAELPLNQHEPKPQAPAAATETELGSIDFSTMLLNLSSQEAIESPNSYLLDYSDQGTEDNWQTLNFPNSINIDDIPITSDLEIEQALAQMSINPNVNSTVSPKSPESGTLILALHECNRDLAKRIAELEAALNHSDKLLGKQDKLLEQKTLEINTNQEQVSRLFQQLKMAHQVIQRQEVEAETLQAKIGQMQTQVAQMERECTCTQQRYEQQVLRLALAENNCRELRSRLHRQQRQTLQFKAALNKYLTIANVNNLAVNSQEKLEHSDPNFDHVTKETEAIVSMRVGSSSPVKPWSAGNMVSLPPVTSQVIDQESIKNLPDEKVKEEVSLQPELPAIQKIATYGYLEPLKPELSPIHNEEKTVNINSKDAPNKIDLLEIKEVVELRENMPLDDDIHQIEDTEIIKTRQVFSSLKINKTPVTNQANNSELSNWPAPLINPAKSKKRESLAAIELPSFR